jgi:hypothetical protein
MVLQGTVGQQAACGIYKRLSSTCPVLRAGDAQCPKARQRHGLQQEPTATQVPQQPR